MTSRSCRQQVLARTVNLSASESLRGALHVQNENSCHRRFRQWLMRFNGVTPLPTCLGWQWAIDSGYIDTAERMLR